MLFTSPAFVLGFLPVTLGGFWFFGRNGRTTLPLLWLFLASLSFYAWWRPVFVPFLIASIAANYILGTSIARAVVLDRRERAQILMVIGVTGNLLLLGWFKYAGFFFGVNSGAILPLGISFFTFQQIAFLVDAQRGIQSVTPPLAYASFVAFFPHLIAGPIVRAREIVPQLSRCGARGIQSGAFTAGCTIFLLGLAKKLVLADTFAHFADIGFDAAAHDGALTFFEAWYAALAYALQIYYDFSGYSDMAIGLARMFNVGFPLNLDSPYQATTIAEFWRRWHITLGNFLREYVYIPLGGNRRGESRRNHQPDGDHAAWRFVARRRFHLRSLGRVARPVSGHARALATHTHNASQSTCLGNYASCCRYRLGAVPCRRHAHRLCRMARHGGTERNPAAPDGHGLAAVPFLDRTAGRFAAIPR